CGLRQLLVSGEHENAARGAAATSATQGGMRNAALAAGLEQGGAGSQGHLAVTDEVDWNEALHAAGHGDAGHRREQHDGCANEELLGKLDSRLQACDLVRPERSSRCVKGQCLPPSRYEARDGEQGNSEGDREADLPDAGEPGLVADDVVDADDAVEP